MVNPVHGQHLKQRWQKAVEMTSSMARRRFVFLPTQCCCRLVGLLTPHLTWEKSACLSSSVRFCSSNAFGRHVAVWNGDTRQFLYSCASIFLVCQPFDVCAHEEGFVFVHENRLRA